MPLDISLNVSCQDKTETMAHLSQNKVQLRPNADFALSVLHSWKFTKATNMLDLNIHVSIYQVGNINICLLYILKIVKMQMLDKICQ